MKKNLYYRNVIRRQDYFRNFINNFFLSFASYPRLLLEVFIRKNFGERYFRIASAVTLAALLAALPFIIKWITGAPDLDTDADPGPGYDEDAYRPYRSAPGKSFFTPYITWFVFLAAFLIACFLRYREVRRNPSSYDFAKYSLSSGDINKAFLNIKLPGDKNNIRIIETFLEPLPFFIAGLILWLLGQKLGLLLTACSVFYCLGYVAAYNVGDDFVLDKIDEIICNEELKKSFVDGEGGESTRGFRFVGDRPGDADLRRKLLPLMTEEDDTVVAG